MALSWTAPASDGGTAITGYRIVDSKRTGQTWSPWVSADQAAAAGTQAVVSGLVNGSAYVFHVAALNEAGQGLFSSSGVLATPIAVATAPTAARAIRASRRT